MSSRHSTKRSGASRRDNNERQVPAWVWLFTGAVLGGFVMFLLHLSDVQTPPAEVSNTDKQEPHTSPQNELPRFDFYDRLKNISIPVPEDTRTEIETAPKEDIEFLLQVASFRQAQDAEQLRAELILMNLEAHIEKAEVRNGETWHRVLVGPFASRSYLAKARQTLLSNGHQALLLKRKHSEKQ